MTDDEDGMHFSGNTTGSYHPEIKKKKGFLRFFGRYVKCELYIFHRKMGDQSGPDYALYVCFVHGLLITRASFVRVWLSLNMFSIYPP